MIVGDDIFVMLLTHDKFKTFTPNPISDARKSTEVLVALSFDSRQEVDEMVRKAVAAGGNTYKEPQGPRLHVRARVPGSGRPYLGNLLDGPSAIKS